MTAARVASGTILDRILDRTAIDLEERKRACSLEDMERQAASIGITVSFRDAIAGPGISVIAEIKRASPSRGIFPVKVSPVEIAREYLTGGASVLTDYPFFHGSLSDLQAAAAVAHGWTAPAPVLRKDFVIDPYQIVEARVRGADAVLLIVAALDDSTLQALMTVAARLDLDALVEVHDERELDRALGVGATLIGINNRNLGSFDIDLDVTERLAPQVPSGVVLVGESGIHTVEHVQAMADVGIDAILVGESLIIQEDRAEAVRALTGVKKRRRG